MMVSMVYPAGMLSTFPMTPQLRVLARVLFTHMLAAMKRLNGETTMAAPSFPNRTTGPESNPSGTFVWFDDHLQNYP